MAARKQAEAEAHAEAVTARMQAKLERSRENEAAAATQAAAAVAAQRQHAEFASKATEALRSPRGGPAPGWMRSAPPCSGTVVLVLKRCMDVIPADSSGTTQPRASLPLSAHLH